MNLLLFSNDDELVKSLYSAKMFLKVEQRRNIACLNEQCFDQPDVVLISDDIVNFDQLPFLREKFVQQSIFYLLHNQVPKGEFQKVELVAHAENINLIFPNQTSSQINKHLESILKPVDNGDKSRVVAFFGTHPQVGVTSTIMSIASRMGMFTGAKIAVLGLNPWNPGDYYFQYNGIYLDELSTQLANRVLTTTQLLNSMGSYNCFQYLAGNRSIKKQFKYYVEEVSFLIDLAKEVFDLVLIDAGAHFDNAMSLQALANSDVKFLITNQQGWGQRFWTYSYEQIIEPLGYKKSDFLLILNKYQESAQLLSGKQIAQVYGLPLIRNITDLGHLGILAEHDKFILSECNDPNYDKDITALAQILCKLYSLPMATRLTTTAPKKSIFNRLFGVKGA